MPRPSTLAVPVALVLLAGSACSVLAANGLSVSSRGGSAELSYNGRVFHTSGGAVTLSRSFSFPGSTTVLLNWTEAGDQSANFWAISRAGAAPRFVGQSQNRVRLAYGEFDPMAGEPVVPQILRADAGNELFLVQYVATPVEEMIAGVAGTGAVVERSLTDHTQIVRASAEARAAIAALPYVRWVGSYHPAYRTDASTRQMLVEQFSGRPALDVPVRYSIEVMRNDGTQQLELSQFITAIGGLVEMTQSVGTFRMEATLNASQLVQVLHHNAVSYVDPWGPAGTDTTIARQIGGASTILAPAGFSGQGVRAVVQDSEVQLNHPAWNGQTPLINGASAPLSAHGTACYGINFSTGAGGFANTTGFLNQREQGIFAYYGSLSGFGGSEVRLTRTQNSVAPAGNFRAVFETNSWGSAQTTAYTTISAEMDNIIFLTRLFILNSQSNTGNRNSRPQAWAKNVTAVGGISHFATLSRTDDTWNGASIGPAADNRTKPDLAHFYDQTTATWPTSTTTQFSGTSNATPVTAGHAGLIFQMWNAGVWSGFGGAPTVFEGRPAFTTVKAAMAASAFRYTWGAGGANNNINRTVQGWGMADVGKLYNLRTKTFIVNETDSVTTGSVRSYTVNVAAGEPELLVSMSFSDPQGSPTAAQARINDLSLVVISPSGQIYSGNAGLTATIALPNSGSNWSAPTAGVVNNSIDTTENVFVQNPAAGNWTIEVRGVEVVADTVPDEPGVQANFGLWVMGATGSSCYANCDQSTGAPVLTPADFVCFLNRFRAGDPYANCDQSTGTPTLTPADFVCFLNAFRTGCP